MTCSLCRGSGFLFAIVQKRNRWWSCPCCNGVGALECFAPPTIKASGRITKSLAKLNRALDDEDKKLTKEWQQSNNRKFAK